MGFRSSMRSAYVVSLLNNGSEFLGELYIMSFGDITLDFILTVTVVVIKLFTSEDRTI